MKKLLLIFIICSIAGLNAVKSQSCIPNNDTVAGIEPDTLAITYVNLPYNEVIYFHLPGDTIVDFIIGEDTFHVHICIDSLTIDSVQGLPDGFSYGCSVPWCSVLGNGNGCAAISGTADESQIGIYPLEVFITIYTNDCYGFALPPMVDTVSFYYLDIQEATGVNSMNDNPRSSVKCFPNPASTKTAISFYSEQSAEVVISVLNLEGRVIYEKNLIASNGYHKELIDVSSLSESLYTVQVRNKNRIQFTKLQIIK